MEVLIDKNKNDLGMMENGRRHTWNPKIQEAQRKVLD